jgi:uncharacterized membrane protein (UPF0127 family)
MEQGYICLNEIIFSTLFALSAEEQSRGLMYQPHPAPIMSFVYPRPQINKFWMHQTPSSLDIVFCCDGKVSQICRGEPYSTRIIGSDDYSDLVVEFPYGTASSIGLKVGHAIELVKPNKEELQKVIARQYSSFMKF